MPSSRPPQLAPSAGNIWQLVLATSPFLVVLLYLLYQAHVRPSNPLYNLDGVDDDARVKDIYNNSEPIIPLIEMVPIFLTFEFLFFLLASYIFVFLPRRRRLLRTYFDQSDTCLGDVTYTPPQWYCRAGGQYGHVIYTYAGSDQWKIKKKVRVFRLYGRERVTILQLWNRPFSGQPKDDLDIDMKASMRGIRASRIAGYFAILWVLFTALSPLYILRQMRIVQEQDPFEDAGRAFKIYWSVGLIVIPVVCIVGVFARWAAYKHNMVHKGLVLKEGQGEESREDSTLPHVLWNELSDRQEEFRPPDDDSSFSMTNSVVEGADQKQPAKDLSTQYSA